MKYFLNHRKWVGLLSLAFSVIIVIYSDLFVLAEDFNYNTCEVSFTQVAKTDFNTLYVNMNTADFALENNASGKIWYSVPSDIETDEKTVGTKHTLVSSHISVGYIERATESGTQSVSYANSSVYCSEDSITVDKIKDGVKVVYKFEDFGFVIPVTYKLNKNYFEATILVNDIVETSNYYIISINLLPVFGAGNSTSTGKLFIPDGCGAYVDFNNNITMLEDYSAPVYGEDISSETDSKSDKTESVRLPVFATLTDSNSLTGIIEKGDANASITFINGNEKCGYNSVSSIFNYRVKSQKEVFNGTNSKNTINKVSRVTSLADEYKVRYYTINSESIVDVAGCYRDYLQKCKKLKSTKDFALLNLDVYGSVDTEGSFMGIPYRKQKVLTSYYNLKDIIKILNKEGVSSLSVRYVGWNNSGISNLKITSNAKPLSILGGKNGINTLVKYAENKDVCLYLDNDIIRLRKSGNGISKKNDVSKTVFGDVAEYQQNVRSSHFAKSGQLPITYIRPNLVRGQFAKLFKSYEGQKYGLKTIGVTFTSNTVYSSLDSNAGVMRDVAVQNYLSIYNLLKKRKYKMVSDSANAYAIPYSEKIVNVPVCSSGYNCFNGDVPFYEMVLHGIIPMATKSITQSTVPQNQFLKSVELGCGISYNCIYNDASFLIETLYDNLFSSTFSNWKKQAVSYYSEYESLYNKISKMQITDYNILANDIVKTVYDDKIAVYVNYNDFDVSVDGITVAAKSFAETEV